MSSPDGIQLDGLVLSISYYTSGLVSPVASGKKTGAFHATASQELLQAPSKCVNTSKPVNSCSFFSNRFTKIRPARLCAVRVIPRITSFRILETGITRMGLQVDILKVDP